MPATDETVRLADGDKICSTSSFPRDTRVDLKRIIPSNINEEKKKKTRNVCEFFDFFSTLTSQIIVSNVYHYLTSSLFFPPRKTFKLLKSHDCNDFQFFSYFVEPFFFYYFVNRFFRNCAHISLDIFISNFQFSIRLSLLLCDSWIIYWNPDVMIFRFHRENRNNQVIIFESVFLA